MLAAVLLSTLSPPPSPAIAAADSPTEVLAVAVTPRDGSTTSGFLWLRVDVTLRDADGLLDEQDGALDDETVVVAGRASRGDRLPAEILWPRMTRVSGTPQHGTWRGHVVVTPAWVGQYAVTRVQAFDVNNRGGWIEVSSERFTVGGEHAWKITADPEPVRVVTGREQYIPRARLHDRHTGAPIAGWVANRGVEGYWYDLARRTSEPGVRLDASGVWTGRWPITIRHREHECLDAYARRGTRGWSLEAASCVDALIKWQANSRYSALSLRVGETLAVAGNAWPAPDITYAANRNIYLQQVTRSGVWETVAASQVRDNGRYTLTFTPTRPGVHRLRVRKPGFRYSDGNGSIGTTLAPVDVHVR